MFRSAAITVANSIHKGQPVTVHGRFRTAEWEGEAGTRVDLVIDATSVGHDLTRGTAEFTRAFGDAGLAADASGADEHSAESMPDDPERDGEDDTEGDVAAEEDADEPAPLALSA